MNAQIFLDLMAATANQLSLDERMNLISKQISYQGLNVIADTPDRIMFKPIETVEGVDGEINSNGIQFIIQKEEDGQWCVSQERILPADELENDQRRGAL